MTHACTTHPLLRTPQNVCRVPLIRKYNLPDTFEFSQSYTFFWDKVERANYFLEAMIELVDEPVDVINARVLAL